MSCALQVERLECRFLPNGANSVVLGAPTPDAVAAYTASAQGQGAPTSAQDDGDEGGAAPSTEGYGAGAQQVALDARLDANRTTHPSLEREHEYEAHTRHQFLAEAPHDRPAHAVTETPRVGAATDTASGSAANNAATHHSGSPSSAASPPLDAPLTPGAVPSEVDHASERTTDPPQPAPSAPAGPVITASASDPSPALPDTSASRAWRDVLLDPLGGVPLRDAVSVDLAALGAEAEQFLARVADLGADRADGAEWGDYVWLAGGVLLVCGGVRFVRASRDARGLPDRLAGFEEPEERR